MGSDSTLEQDQAALASAQAAANATPASAGGYLAVQVPTLEGQVAIDEQLLQIAEGNSNTITAPIAGYVSSVRVSPGQIVNPGASLVQIVNPAQVVVNAGMQLSDLQSIAVGDAATITPSQLPDVHLHGTVVAVSAAATGDGLEGTVVVSAPNLADHPVPIGTQSIVNVSAPQHAAVSVPTLAVLNVQIAPVVGVVRHNRIYFQPVEIGASDGTRTQILSGLQAGQRVAVSNMQLLTDGDKVQGILGRHMSFTAVNLPAPAPLCGRKTMVHGRSPFSRTTRQSVAVRTSIGFLFALGSLALPWLGLTLSPDLSAWNLTSVARGGASGASHQLRSCHRCAHRMCTRFIHSFRGSENHADPRRWMGVPRTLIDLRADDTHGRHSHNVQPPE